MAAINAQQIRKIYAIGNALGIVERGNEDDDLHALVSALTGKDSVKSLTYAEAQAVITDLQKRQGAAPLPFIWLDFRACNKLIEVLKGYVNNAKRGGGHG